MLRAGLASRTQHIALRLHWVPSQTAWLASGAGVSAWLLSAGAEYGPTLHFEPIEIPMRVGLEGGAFFADARGVAQHRGGAAAWFAAYLSSGFATTLPNRVRVGFWVDGLLALRRPKIALSETGSGLLRFYRPAPAAVRGAISVELLFP